jgi:hypothetical protein
VISVSASAFLRRDLARRAFGGRRLWCFLHAYEKIQNSHFERLRYEVKAGQRDIHPPVLECSDLCAMESCKIGEFVLRPSSIQSKFSNPQAQPLLDLLPLQQQQFRGILLKRILLISRVYCWLARF